MDFSFDDFTSSGYGYDSKTRTFTNFHLSPKVSDIGGGKIDFSDIDVLADHPEVDNITVSGL